MKSVDNFRSRKNLISLYSRLSNSEKKDLIDSYSLLTSTKQVLTFNDLINFERAKELLSPISKKYNLNLSELFEVAKSQILIPIKIFNSNLTVLESVVKFLKEDKELSLSKISEVLGRDQRNVWHIYDNSKKKLSKQFEIKDFEFLVPVSIFADPKLSALESVVCYLKEDLGLRYHKIAVLLSRDDRTIWTVYQRARKKNGE